MEMGEHLAYTRKCVGSLFLSQTIRWFLLPTLFRTGTDKTIRRASVASGIFSAPTQKGHPDGWPFA
ncbi:hypothetical protein, partial [Escherichia whittamii]|uniref:hypothetical protein n=1 Tax=Escherichia whittamii TaxID=2762229 RepID=UPI002E2332CB|nr:hypothetical protein [Escherichia whittamii]MEC9560988.1 hypothetical protein [Escherichia whittamii]